MLKNDLKVAIIRARKTQEQVAAEVGVNPQHISDIITGRRKPSLDLVFKILISVGKKPDIQGVFWWEDSAPGN
jgi:DNA-binding XRE family transcriptional regulator